MSIERGVRISSRGVSWEYRLGKGAKEGISTGRKRVAVSCEYESRIVDAGLHMHWSSLCTR